MNIDELERLANRLRKHSIRMINRAKSSHVGGNFSMAEIMAVLYGRILKLKPEQPDWEDRDRFILSKGHAAAIYYAVLAERGFFPIEWLDSFYTNGARFAGHASQGVPGIEISSGSLGHGLPMADGMALAAKIDEKSYRIYSVLSDGECQEGSTWEAVMFAAHHHLDNLVVIVDYNKIQAMGNVSDIVNLEPFAERWRSFGWSVQEVDGHNVSALVNSLEAIPFTSGKPSCVIAHTIKGKGVSFMENTVLWHYRSPQGEEYDSAMLELNQE